MVGLKKVIPIACDVLGNEDEVVPDIFAALKICESCSLKDNCAQRKAANEYLND